MATKYYYLSGKTKWAKVRKPDEKYNNFQVPLYLDEPSLKLFDSLGLGLQKKTDADGVYVTFKRPMSKIIKQQLVQLGPPKAFNKDNTEFTGLIGNGSTVTVKIAVYDTIKGLGHTLESVRVEDLVEYNPPAPASAAPAADAGRPALPF